MPYTDVRLLLTGRLLRRESLGRPAPVMGRWTVVGSSRRLLGWAKMFTRTSASALIFAHCASANACSPGDSRMGSQGDELPPGTRAVAITADGAHTCVILEPGRQVRCWGSLGSRPFPDAPEAAFSRIDAGDFDVCGLRADNGEPVCWGLGADGIRHAPARVAFSHLSVGSGNACAVRSTDGVVECWGRDDSGQSSPPQDRSFASVSNARFTTCGVVSPNGEALCWGGGEEAPWNPVSPEVPLRSISNAAFLSCGVRREDSRLSCWDDFLPGDAQVVGQPPTDTPLVDVSVGTNHACAVLDDGAVQCWGENDDGECDVPTGVRFTRVAVGAFHSCGILAEDGRIACWGGNSEAQVMPPDALRAP